MESLFKMVFHASDLQWFTLTAAQKLQSEQR